ncbi:alpha/beta hydrolase [Micromonospora sp. NPDC000663]|uniref:alpha/beta hydrolase n=1 Tax=Micromonospora sp. NPDC000663 TaxID=3364218 RepID=UPI0036BD90DB
MSNFVFVPGVNHGGWCWNPVGRRVRDAGHAAYALTLPGLTLGDDTTGLQLADAVKYVVDEVERRDLHDVVLVGHSFAGVPISGAASRLRERLTHLAFFSAFIPRSGESMASALGPQTAAWIRATAEASPGGTIDLDFETLSTRLMQDEPAVLQRMVFEQLTPHPGGYVLDAWEGEDLRTLGVPMTYLLAERDIALAAPGSELASRLGVEPVMVPGTHEALLTHPDELAGALLKATVTPGN